MRVYGTPGVLYTIERTVPFLSFLNAPNLFFFSSVFIVEKSPLSPEAACLSANVMHLPSKDLNEILVSIPWRCNFYEAQVPLLITYS